MKIFLFLQVLGRITLFLVRGGLSASWAGGALGCFSVWAGVVFSLHCQSHFCYYR